jgi:hypothetical protein
LRQYLLGISIGMLLLLSGVGIGSGSPPVIACCSQAEPLPAATSSATTVVLARSDDPYYSLAAEIAAAEQLPLVTSLDKAFGLEPVFLLWVVSPARLSDQNLSDFGLALRDRPAAVSVGLISGSTLKQARALWQRRVSFSGRRLVAVAREQRLSSEHADDTTRRPLTRTALLAALEQSDYFIYDGHGTRRSLGFPGDDRLLAAADLPPLPPLVVSAGACQTFQLWSEESIALGFTDRGAAAYAGFVHSPNGYLLGEPDGFPWAYTWPDFPIGHALQVQNQGLRKGFLYWPFYLLLGDPRLALQTGPPYTLVEDKLRGHNRTLHYVDAPAGVIPVHIQDGAPYTFVNIPTVAAAWAGDPFYNGVLQMVNLGPDKYLLFVHQGGDFTVRLSTRPPWYWPVIDPVINAMDHTTILHHFEGSLMPNLLITGLVLLGTAWWFWRHRANRSPIWPAVITGLGLAALHGAYALIRFDYLSLLYSNWLHTIGQNFEINPFFLISFFLLTASSAWLYLNTRSSWAKLLAVLIPALPTLFMAVFWFGVVTFINVLAQQKLGAPLYGSGRWVMALITGAVQGGLVGAAFLGLGYLVGRQHLENRS